MKKWLKAQAALEFLTTYGWAFLVILIMISALAYFGILNPSQLLPDWCKFGTEIVCQDFVLDGANNQLKLRLKNNVGETINVNSFTFSSDTATPFSCGSSSASNWKNGDVQGFTFSGCNYAAAGMQSGSKGKISITMTYYAVKSGSGYGHDVKGEIYANVI